MTELFVSFGTAMLIGVLCIYAVLVLLFHDFMQPVTIPAACHKRARPIVTTTIAMGAGMLPVALGLGAEPSFRSPMAIAVIGSLITSTFLSLLVIPVVFTYADDLLRLLRRLVPHRHRDKGGKQGLPVLKGH